MVVRANLSMRDQAHKREVLRRRRGNSGRHERMSGRVQAIDWLRDAIITRRQTNVFLGVRDPRFSWAMHLVQGSWLPKLVRRVKAASCSPK